MDMNALFFLKTLIKLRIHCQKLNVCAYKSAGKMYRILFVSSLIKRLCQLMVLEYFQISVRQMLTCHVYLDFFSTKLFKIL